MKFATQALALIATTLLTGTAAQAQILSAHCRGFQSAAPSTIVQNISRLKLDFETNEVESEFTRNDYDVKQNLSLISEANHVNDDGKISVSLTNGKEFVVIQFQEADARGLLESKTREMNIQVTSTNLSSLAAGATAPCRLHSESLRIEGVNDVDGQILNFINTLKLRNQASGTHITNKQLRVGAIDLRCIHGGPFRTYHREHPERTACVLDIAKNENTNSMLLTREESAVVARALGSTVVQLPLRGTGKLTIDCSDASACTVSQN